MKWNHTDDGDEPSFRQPEWDAPINSPSVPVFIIGACLVILLTFAALEFSEWMFR